MLKVWGRRSAFNVQKVMWLLGELSLEHEHVEAAGSAGRLDDPAFLAMNPHRRIPVIDDGGTVVWESHTILRYLAARHGGGFWSDDPAERSRAERWMDWSQTTLQPAFMDLFWGYWRTPETQRDEAAVADALARCLELYGLLDRWLADRAFLAGDDFGLADIPAGTTLHRFFGMGLDLPPLPRVEAWHGRLAARPAWREHVMLPFDDLYGRTAY